MIGSSRPFALARSIACELVRFERESLQFVSGPIPKGGDGDSPIEKGQIRIIAFVGNDSRHLPRVRVQVWHEWVGYDLAADQGVSGWHGIRWCR